MLTLTLPFELLTEIFKYNENDYKSLYSCVLVNKHWHNISIPILWRNPFNSKGSTKITVNCLLGEDKDFLSRNGIDLTFKLLENPPLYNYTRFCTIFSFNTYFLMALVKTGDLKILRNGLTKFILEHSIFIREMNTVDIDFYWINGYHRFDNSLQNLNKLTCRLCDSFEFIDKLTKICRCIHSLRINYSRSNPQEIFLKRGLIRGSLVSNTIEDSLINLIRAQNQIKYLRITHWNQVLSDNFKKAVLTHSQSITNYSSVGANDLDCVLLPSFKNLTTLSLLSNNSNDDEIKYLKNILLPNLQIVFLYIRGLFLSDLSDFISINGKLFKHLSLGSIPNGSESLGRLFQSIAQCCKNLVHLSIFYKNEVDQELMEILNNCIKLEHITFKKVTMDPLDGDKILLALNQTSPKKLKSINCFHEVSNISENSFDSLMKNWKGPKPFTIKFKSSSKINGLDNLIKKYQDLGFLN